MISAASYPPSPKTRGRGTHSFIMGKENRVRKDGPPAGKITMNRNTEKIFGAVITTCCIVGLAGLIWTSAIWSNYQRDLPKHPDPVTGNTYPLNVHGIVVYQTREQRNDLDRIQYSSIGVFVGAALMAVIHKKKKHGTDARPLKDGWPGL